MNISRGKSPQIPQSKREYRGRSGKIPTPPSSAPCSTPSSPRKIRRRTTGRKLALSLSSFSRKPLVHSGFDHSGFGSILSLNLTLAYHGCH